MLDGSDPFVRFKNVQKSYDGETLVVKNLNLEIEAGEFVTMLGPSGSGKTTFLSQLSLDLMQAPATSFRSLLTSTT